MTKKRLHFLQISILAYFLIVISRLFYWQILNGPKLKEQALSQTLSIEKIDPKRGNIYFSDDALLAINQDYYLLSIYKPNLKENLTEVINKINQIKTNFLSSNQEQLDNFSRNTNQKWISLKLPFTLSESNSIKIPGVTFSRSSSRLNPEGSLAKNIAGFTRQDSLGNIYGISGLEGYYNKQLTGRSGFFWGNLDATGKISLAKKWLQIPATDGQNIYTTINRGIQDLIESTLQEGIDKYNADSGSIVIMSPKDGQVVALASTSSASATSSATKNIAIADLFEPGSIFKPLVVSMALQNKAIDTDYICDKCDRPHSIGQYSISNWDNALHPNSSLQDIIKNSDNIGMSYIIQRLGLENFRKYFDSLGLTAKSGIDLQGEARPMTKNDWPEIDLATASFGQGFAINQIQMIRAFNTIANNGYLVDPKIVKNQISYRPQIFSQKTTSEIKSILKYAVENGATSKFKPNDLEVCAKSGTAQVAVKGSYTDSSTIASYIGFSPCNDPQFTMIVTINNPRTSPWGSSTAAPIWYELASRIRYLL